MKKITSLYLTMALMAVAPTAFAQNLNRDRDNNRSITWEMAEGKPAITPGKKVGVYIWHEGTNVYLATTTNGVHSQGINFTGRVDVHGGRILNPTGLQNEKNDKVTQTGAQSLRYSFRTEKSMDGVKFTVSNVDSITFSVRYEGKDIRQIYVGRNATEWRHGPLTMALNGSGNSSDTTTIPWSQAEGRPSIPVGRSNGVYLWHNGNDIVMITSRNTAREEYFLGSLRVEGGTLFSPSSYAKLDNDRFRLVNGKTLRFRFKTGEEKEGLKISLKGGRRLILEINQQGKVFENVHYGGQAQEAHQYPVIFDLTR